MMARTMVVSLALVALLSACRGDTISQRYEFLDADIAELDIDQYSALWMNAESSMPFDSILLRRQCGGECPEYTVVLARDGRARFEGESTASRPGKWTGEVDFMDFARLCQLIE